MEKENWINEVMQSTKGIKPIDANPFLFEKIAQKIEANKKLEAQEKPFLKGWILAASLVLAINITSFTHILIQTNNY
jgi:hypothetical protein